MLLKGTTQSSSTILRLTICAAHASTPLCYSWRTANIASWRSRRRSDISDLDKLIKMCNDVPLHPATVLVSSSGNSAEKDIASWAPCHNLCSADSAPTILVQTTHREPWKIVFLFFVIFHSWTCTRANIFSIRRNFSRICIRCPFPALIIVWILD